MSIRTTLNPNYSEEEQLDKLVSASISVIYIVIAFAVTTIFIRLIEPLSRKEDDGQEKDR